MPVPMPDARDRAAPPTVSIVLPTYQRAALLGRSIDSVLAQSWDDFELIVVDDGSTDETGAVLASRGDPRLRVLRQDVNRGAAAARNAGIGAAAGRFLAFQDSDDEWLPEKLARHMAAFAARGPEIGVVYSDMQRIHSDGGEEYHRSPTILGDRLLNPETRFYQVCQLGIQATVIRRECFAATGLFNEAFPALEDLELFIRLSRRTRFHHLPEALVRYHETDGLSKDTRSKVVARTLLLELYGRELMDSDPGFVDRERAAIDAARQRLQPVEPRP